MAGVAVASPKQQFLDGAGMPLAMGFVHTYLAGTSTESTTWQDRAQLVENENPIPLDQYGAAAIMLDPALAYRFEVTDALGALQPHLGGDNIVGAAGTQILGDVVAAKDAALAEIDTAKDAGLAEMATSVSAAQIAQAAAQAAQTGAQAAETGALLNAGLKLSVDDGLATTTTGQTFGVISGPFVVYYQNSAGAALELGKVLATNALLSGFGISALGNTDITPWALGTPTQVGWFEVAPAYLSQDRFGATPVTALGQLVGMHVPINVEAGPPLIPQASASFTSAAGWTVGAGWAINTAGAGKAVATAAGGILQYATALNATKRYTVDVKIANYSAGTLQVDVGAGFTNVPLTANGTYKLRIPCGGAPTGGLYLRTVGFTGELESVQIAEASPWIVVPPADAERGTYMLDANGAPHVDWPTGKHAKTNSIIAQVVPSYACVALGRAAVTSLAMVNFGFLSFTDGGTAYHWDGFSALSGQFHNPGMRGSADVANPAVQDLYLEAGFTSSYTNNGQRNVLKEVGLASQAERRVPNNFTGAETLANAYVGFNYSAGGASAANSKFYGGVFTNGIVMTLATRRKIIEHFQTPTKLLSLREPEYDLFGFIGQSNMMGVGDQATSTTPAFGTAAEYIDAGYIKPLKDPTQHAVPSNTAGSGSLLPAFGASYFAACGRRVLAVGCGASGVGLVNSTALAYGNWLTGQYAKFFAFKFRNAMKDVRCIPRAAVYLGGEQDATIAITQAAYEVLLVQLRDKIRLETGLPTLPLLIISLDDSTGSPPQMAIMRAAMNNVSMNGVGATNPTEGIYLIVQYQNYLAAGNLPGGIHRNQTALNNDGLLGGAAAAALFPQ